MLKLNYDNFFVQSIYSNRLNSEIRFFTEQISTIIMSGISRKIPSSQSYCTAVWITYTIYNIQYHHHAPLSQYKKLVCKVHVQTVQVQEPQSRQCSVYMYYCSMYGTPIYSQKPTQSTNRRTAVTQMHSGEFRCILCIIL